VSPQGMQKRTPNPRGRVPIPVDAGPPSDWYREFLATPAEFKAIREWNRRLESEIAELRAIADRLLQKAKPCP